MCQLFSPGPVYGLKYSFSVRACQARTSGNVHDASSSVGAKGSGFAKATARRAGQGMPRTMQSVSRLRPLLSRSLGTTASLFDGSRLRDVGDDQYGCLARAQNAAPALKGDPVLLSIAIGFLAEPQAKLLP